jgi:hypothetical protein
MGPRVNGKGISLKGIKPPVIGTKNSDPFSANLDKSYNYSPTPFLPIWINHTITGGYKISMLFAALNKGIRYVRMNSEPWSNHHGE